MRSGLSNRSPRAPLPLRGRRARHLSPFVETGRGAAAAHPARAAERLAGGERAKLDAAGAHSIHAVPLATFALLLLTLLAPNALRAIAEHRLRGAAQEIVRVLQTARFKAVCRSEAIGVRFVNAPAGGVLYGLVRQRCVQPSGELGHDPTCPSGGLRSELLGGWAPLAVRPDVRLGFPHGRAVRDPLMPSRYLARLEEPVRFADTDMVLFDPYGGGARAGSLFLTDGERLVAISVAEGAGAALILDYDFEREQWREQ
jgi:hypothetical protein